MRWKPGAFVTRVIFAAALIFGCALRAETRVITAAAREKILVEELGGCSMRCAFPWKVAVIPPGDGRGTFPVMTGLLNDERIDAPWFAGGNGVGTKLMFSFPKSIPKDMDGEVPFFGIDFANGDHRSALAWRRSARLKRVRLSYNGKALYEIHLPDSRRWTRVEFDDIMVHAGDIMTLEVLEVYPGLLSKNLAISEVSLQGAH